MNFPSNNYDSLSNLMNTVIKPLAQHRRQSIDDVSNLLTSFSEIRRQEKENLYNFGTGFNPLQQLTIDEPTHSRLIGNLLRPTYHHGVGKLFLLLFLDILGIQNPEEGHWTVDIESSGVDILIKRHLPHSIIIVENKSNHAADQIGQLYRYWYQQIYLPNKNQKDLNFLNRETYIQPEIRARYRILYVAPTTIKVPAEYSLKRPKLYESALPENLPMPHQHVTFMGLIVPWLENCRDIIPATNTRLREYLNMYIEYWKAKNSLI